MKLHNANSQGIQQGEGTSAVAKGYGGTRGTRCKVSVVAKAMPYRQGLRFKVKNSGKVKMILDTGC
jgi:hypothetical protein